MEFSVLVKEPKYRKGINSNQVRLLNVLYMFRFGTTDLIGELLNKNRSTIYESLYVLERQGYISKLYSKEFRLQGRPAIYTLAPGGIKYLRDTDMDNYSETHLRNFYKNRKTNQEIIDRSLMIFRIAVELKNRYSKSYVIYSKYLLNKDAFVDPLPDLYLKGKEEHPDFVLDYIEPGTASWLIRRRIRQHEEFADEEDDDYPNVMFITGNATTEKRIFSFTYENYNDFEFYLTQNDLLADKDEKIWIDYDESDDEDLVRQTIQ